MGKRDPEYFREKARKNRKIDRELSKRYQSFESIPGETFSQFKKRKKHELF